MSRPALTVPTWALPRLSTVPVPFASARNRLAAQSRNKNIADADRATRIKENKRRSEVARLGGIARAKKLSKERLREIGRQAAVIRLAKSTPEQRSLQASRAAIACNAKRWGTRSGS